MNTFFTADLHFNDYRNFNHFGYGANYKNQVDRDNDLIAMWNSTVRPDDIVYILGDYFVFYYAYNTTNGQIENTTEAIAEQDKFVDYTKRLNGKKSIILGNHDNEIRRYGSIRSFLTSQDIYVYDYPIIFKNWCILSHEPMYVTPDMPYINIFGHVHNNQNYRTFSSCGACVCWDRVRLIEWNELSSEIDKLRKATNIDVI